MSEATTPTAQRPGRDPQRTSRSALNLIEDLKSYRQHLVLAEQKAQDDYDKTVVYLSGGALAISFAFLEKITGSGPPINPNLLLFAWCLWAASLSAVLISYGVSRIALKQAIKQCDTDTIQGSRPGGFMSLTTEVLNFLSGSCFIAGIIVVTRFVLANLEK